MLAIDCGNTRIKWARFESGHRLDAGDAKLRGENDPFAKLADALTAMAGSVGRVAVANVAGAETAVRIASTIEETLGISADFVRVEPTAHGIECGYEDPGTLGVDRWLAMIAARRLVDGAFVVVCAGTAVTFDAVDAEGRHLGGLILPGDQLMIAAMAANTGQIPVVERAGRPVTGLNLLGRSTAQAVGHGTRLALAAAIDRATQAVAEASPGGVSLIVTGGDGPAIAEWLASNPVLRADLVLDGLAVIAGHED